MQWKIFPALGDTAAAADDRLLTANLPQIWSPLMSSVFTTASSMSSPTGISFQRIKFSQKDMYCNHTQGYVIIIHASAKRM